MDYTGGYTLSDVEDAFDAIDDFTDEEDSEIHERMPKRYHRDQQNPFERWREKEFEARFRFSKDAVLNLLLPIIRDDLDHCNNRGLPVPSEIVLLTGLRYYATNDFQLTQADVMGYSQPTISTCIRKVSEAYAKRFKQFVKFPDTVEEQLVNIQLFYEMAGMPGVACLADGVLIPICSPGIDIAELFRCRKGYFAMNVLAACDPRGKWTYMDTRQPGGCHDQTCLDRSALKLIFLRRLVKGHVIADNGFGCEKWCLVPFVDTMNGAEDLYNDALRTTRSFIERNFGRWKKKFPCLKRVLSTKLDTSIATICATAVLWNIYINLKFPSRVDLRNFSIDPNALAEPPQGDVNGLDYRVEFVMNHFL